MTNRVDVTFRVDPASLFDSIAKVDDGGDAIGTRLVCVLLSPNNVRFTERVGMGFYGVEFLRAEAAPADATTADPGSVDHLEAGE